MPEKHILKRASALLCALVIAAVSGCNAQERPPAAVCVPSGTHTDISEEISSDTYEPVISSEESTGPSEISMDPEPTEDADISSEEADPSQEVSDPPEEIETPPERTTAATTTPTTTASATVTTAASAPPAEVVIPDVKTVSSPGVDVASSDSGVIDWSNASLGYISAAYTGASTGAKLRIICGDMTYDHDLSPDGADCYFPLSCGSGTYSVILYEKLSGTKYSRAVEAEFTAKISDEIAMFLYPNDYVMFTKKSACVKKAAELCAGKDDVIEKTAAVFGWITDNITYDYDLAAAVQSGYLPDPDSVLSRRKGICFDYASLVAAMLRSQGIPTRLVVGYASPNIYHAWNEVYTAETGWITPQLLLSSKGYNIVDATFYASASDKSAISAYISNGANYSAIYYY